MIWSAADTAKRRESRMGEFTGYYRFPSIHGNRIVFTYEDDQWLFDEETETATRLTTSEGMALNGIISPDGKYLAFAGSDRGVKEVYTLDLESGATHRLTYTGYAEPIA